MKAMQSPEAVVTARYGGPVVMNSALLVDRKQTVQILQVPQVPPPPYPVRILPNQISTQIARAKPATCRTAQNEENALVVINDEDRMAIYKHPLFPLMAVLFEKCEQATQTSDCLTTESINDDIASFVDHFQDKKSVLHNSEVDELMVQAIEVLRMYILEIERLNDLCKEFCTRYLSNVKSKIQNEQLLRVDGMDFESPGSSPNSLTSQISGVLNADVVPVYQMIQTPQGLMAQSITKQIQIAPAPGVIQGSAVIAQASTKPPQVLPQRTYIARPVKVTTVDDDGKARRGVLPKRATQVMKSWLFQHIVHPYPTEEEKRDLSQQTGLSILQINNWFINARRRILQPMLESTATDFNKSKKPKPPQNRPQKFWPEHLSNYLNKQSDESEEAAMHDSLDADMHTDSELPQSPLTNKGFTVHPNVLDILHHETNSAVENMIMNVQNATSVLVAHNDNVVDVSGTHIVVIQSNEQSEQSHVHCDQSCDRQCQSHDVFQSGVVEHSVTSPESLRRITTYSQETGEATDNCDTVEYMVEEDRQTVDSPHDGTSVRNREVTEGNDNLMDGPCG